MRVLKFTLGLCALALGIQAQPKFTSSMLGALEPRMLGPGTMSGRITAIEAINNNPRIVYVGSAGGGVWKSTNAGASFKPIFDKYNQSIGAITIDQQHPDTLWVGTGESNMRNSVSIGEGLYLSTDGGSNWKKMGLDSTEHISKIIINPSNPQDIWVAVPGPLWSSSTHRGLYHSTNGGATWEKALYINTETGCADVIMDPKNTKVLYASTWQFRRQPWSFNSGGPGSALYKSEDAGKTWRKIQKGFDGEVLGRICLALSPSDSKKLYAIAESKNTALYMSADAGENWTKKSATSNVVARPFYFSLIVVDPVESNRVYRPAFTLSISTDGGESFKEATSDGGWTHSDHHALWINPNNNNHLLLGTDGGMYQSLDKGNSWSFFGNLPVGQFYHVAADNETPYNIYGGLQDNSNWVGASAAPGGVGNDEWKNIGGGDGFWVQPDPIIPDLVYAESQGGEMYRINKKNNLTKDIKPYAKAGETKLRFNWNTPLVLSKKNKGTLYTGAQYVYKTTNQGDTWERISPDLTTNNPKKLQQENSGGLSADNTSAENHCTIFAIDDSPLDANLLWVGTDDGQLHVTTNGGGSWSNLTANLKDLPANTWVSSICASPDDKQTAFVTFDGHATGDMNTYLYKTKDLGKTWERINNAVFKGYAHKIVQDSKRPELLFLGTEMGLFISFDGGKQFVHWITQSMPPAAVRDIFIHPTTNDMLLATHGRGIVVLDDISPLRGLKADVLQQEMTIVSNNQPPLTSGSFGGAFPGTGGWVEGNPDENVKVYYFLKDRANVEVNLEILDASGKLIKSVPGGKRKGLNLVTWDKTGHAPRTAKGVTPDGASFTGVRVPEGSYTLRLVKGNTEKTSTVLMKYPTSGAISASERLAQHKALMRLFDLHERLAMLSYQLYGLKDSAEAKAKDYQNQKGLKTAVTKLNTPLDTLNKTLAAWKESKGITGEERLRENISRLYFGIYSYDGKPTDMQMEQLETLTQNVNQAENTFKTIVNKFLPDVNKQLVKLKQPELILLTQAGFDKILKQN